MPDLLPRPGPGELPATRHETPGQLMPGQGSPGLNQSQLRRSRRAPLIRLPPASRAAGRDGAWTGVCCAARRESHHRRRNVTPPTTTWADTPEIRKYKKRSNSEIRCGAVGRQLADRTENGQLMLARQVRPGQGVSAHIQEEDSSRWRCSWAKTSTVTISRKKNRVRVYYHMA